MWLCVWAELIIYCFNSYVHEQKQKINNATATYVEIVV